MVEWFALIVSAVGGGIAGRALVLWFLGFGGDGRERDGRKLARDVLAATHDKRVTAAERELLRRAAVGILAGPGKIHPIMPHRLPDFAGSSDVVAFGRTEQEPRRFITGDESAPHWAREIIDDVLKGRPHEQGADALAAARRRRNG